jgi:hypothetical protein
MGTAPRSHRVAFLLDLNCSSFEKNDVLGKILIKKEIYKYGQLNWIHFIRTFFIEAKTPLTKGLK